MATLLLTRSNTTRTGVKKKTLGQRVTIGANSLVVIIISLICLVSVSYLIQSNRSAAKGFVLKELKEEEQQLSQQANYWALKVSRARSLRSLETSAISRRMSTTTDIVYVNPKDTAVALSK